MITWNEGPLPCVQFPRQPDGMPSREGAAKMMLKTLGAARESPDGKGGKASFNLDEVEFGLWCEPYKMRDGHHFHAVLHFTTKNGTVHGSRFAAQFRKDGYGEVDVKVDANCPAGGDPFHRALEYVTTVSHRKICDLTPFLKMVIPKHLSLIHI